MTSNAALELLAAVDGERITLAAPEVGRFACAVPRGQALVPGQRAGVLLRLGRAVDLVVPEGVRGLVASDAPAAMRAAVESGQILYELAPLGGDQESLPQATAAADTEGALLAPQSGRFYLRPSPTDEAFCAVGDILEAGSPVGLIEVMKTFAQVPYSASGGLPQRARLVEFLVQDGSDVDRGTPLLRVEPA